MACRALLAALAFALVGPGWAQSLSYQSDIQPIFTAKCVACHACYDSPCQLNLGSGEGASRGASKLPVYDGTRTKAQPADSIRCSSRRRARRR